jgi:dipeptidase
MEIYPKGSTELGAVWVASRVPDGYVGSHANQCRTRTFAQDDPANVLFASDVVSFAQKVGYYPKHAPARDFDFAAAYDPLSFSALPL